MPSPPVIDTTSQPPPPLPSNPLPTSSSLAFHRVSAPPLPTLSSSIPPVPPLPSRTLAPRPTSTPLPNAARLHPHFQKRTSSFYYNASNYPLDTEPYPPPAFLLQQKEGDNGKEDGKSTESKKNKNKKEATPSLVSENTFLIYKYTSYFIPFVSVIQAILLIISLTVNWANTGTPIQTNPFNWMIGASPEVLVQMGALYPPCMRPSSILIPKNSSSLVLCSIRTGFPNSQEEGKYNCTYEDLCGPLANHHETPDQEFRVLIAVFLHGGLIHYLLNLSAQWMTLKHVEKVWGPIRIGLVYLMSGTYGFFLSGALHKESSQSSGASGAIFGCIGCFLIDMLVYWKFLHRPGWQFFKFSVVMVLSFALGLMPYFDNFAHIGGFTMGTLVAMLVMPFLSSEKEGWYQSIWIQRQFSVRILPGLVVRIIGLTFTLLLYIVTVNAFYSPGSARTLCPWCQYLNCLPVFSQCR